VSTNAAAAKSINVEKSGISLPLGFEPEFRSTQDSLPAPGFSENMNRFSEKPSA